MAQQDDDPPTDPPPAEPPGNPLFAAIRADDVQMLERALFEGASVDGTAALEEEEATDFVVDTATALMLAIRLGHNRIARLLLERGADVRARGRFGVTAMHVGADVGNVEIIGALAAAGGDLNSTEGFGNTPIWIGAWNGHAGMVKALAELGACVKTPNDEGATPLYVAAENGQAEIVRVLAELGACVKTSSNTGATPVFMAAQEGHEQAVRELAELGACVKTPNDEGVAPVFMAAQQGHAVVVRVLAELGACAKTPKNGGFVPLFRIAAERGRVEVVRELAKLGACVEMAPDDGFAPVHVAAQFGQAEVIRLLAHLKANLTEPTKSAGRWTPLALSADAAHFEATKALLLLGVPITIKDFKQYTDALGNTRQLRADLQAWAADALAQHRAFHGTFLCGCFPRTTLTSVTANPHLPLLAGKPGLLEKIAVFVGIMVGAELRHAQAMGPSIAAVDWAAHDEAWPGVQR